MYAKASASMPSMNIECGEGAYPEASAEFRLTECEATFKVKNFIAAVAATDTVYVGHPDFREIASCPIMSAGDFKFAIVIVWGVDERGRPDLQKKIGVCGRRVDHCADMCTLSMAWKLLNQTDSNSCSGVDRGFFRHSKGHDRGRLPWGESASTLVSLSEAFDVSKGWLHDGALHIRMKLTVVTNSSAVQKPMTGVVPNQQEVCRDFGEMLRMGHFSDVVIEVADECIEAHRAVLACRSPVFAAMLAADMQESRENCIVIKELEPRAVRDMITYLYTGEVKAETWENDDLVLGLLQAAHCYKVDGLVNMCADIIGKRLVLSSVCDRLEFADMLGCDSLKQQSLNFIYQHIAEVQHTEAYSKLCRRPTLFMDIIAMLSPPAKRRRDQDA
mmetsp:Transcript_76074/g.158646  ORF Transcript_76074/g.158646 Transcript_76074/m.158646 type:complete len:388 (+) Transcript_76074:202-1365(+)